MSLSRKHFQALAGIIRYEAEKLCPAALDTNPDYLQGRRDSLNQIKAALAYFYADHNPNFNRARFLAACEPSEKE